MVKPETLEAPCEVKRLVPFQHVVMLMRDTQYQEVTALGQYPCVRCDCNLSGLSRRDGPGSPFALAEEDGITLYLY